MSIYACFVSFRIVFRIFVIFSYLSTSFHFLQVYFACIRMTDKNEQLIWTLFLILYFVWFFRIFSYFFVFISYFVGSRFLKFAMETVPSGFRRISKCLKKSIRFRGVNLFQPCVIVRSLKNKLHPKFDFFSLLD